MGEVIMIWAVPILIILVDFVLIVIVYRNNPPYISKDNKSRYKDSLSVYVYNFVNGSAGSYHKYVYIKKGKAKYRLKLSIIDFICLWLSLLGLGGLYVGLLIDMGNIIIDYPDVGIPFFLALLISLIGLYILFNISRITARVYFRMFMKGMK